KDADELKRSISKLQNEIFLLENQISNIQSSLETTPDISKEKIIKIYEESSVNFSSELKKSLEDLNNFYSQIAKNRIKRLSGQKQEIIREVEQKKELLKKSHKQFDEKLQYLNVHRSEERRVGKECRYRWWMYH